MRRTSTKAVAFAAAVLMLGAVACRSGVTTGVGVDAEKRIIKLGELTPLTGAAAVIGLPLTEGHKVYFRYVNEVLGGVGKDLDADKKYKVELEIRDDKYPDPAIHVQQYNAIKDDVLMIAQSLGTPTTKAILPQINEDKILTGAATLAADWLKEKYVIPAGAPYEAQFINALQYLKEQGKTPKLGIIYQGDDYGEEGLKGLEFAAQKFGFQILAKKSFKPADAAGEASLFLPAVKAMKDAGVDTVFLTSTPSVTGKALGVAATLQYAPQWIGQSPTWVGALAKSPVAPYLQAHLWVVTDASCEWGEVGSGCDGMKELIDNVKKFAPNQVPDYYFIFGYTQARIVHQILEKAVADGDLTREGVVKAFESLSEVDMGGLLNPISYGTKCEDKIPVTASSIFSVDPAAPTGLKRIVKSIDSPAVKEYPFCS
jgi:ABC-type branched-subunit amino acid transport system substrate-binding protein